MDPAIQRLEERVAWLQKHVVEQDKAMLEMAERLERLRRELVEVRARQEARDATGATAEGSPAEERPPHY